MAFIPIEFSKLEPRTISLDAVRLSNILNKGQMRSNAAQPQDGVMRMIYLQVGQQALAEQVSRFD